MSAGTLPNWMCPAMQQPKSGSARTPPHPKLTPWAQPCCVCLSLTCLPESDAGHDLAGNQRPTNDKRSRSHSHQLAEEHHADARNRRVGCPIHHRETLYTVPTWKLESHRTDSAMSYDLPILLEHKTSASIPAISWTKIFPLQHLKVGVIVGRSELVDANQKIRQRRKVLKFGGLNGGDHLLAIMIPAIMESGLFCWRPRRDLNPCYRRERASPTWRFNNLEGAGGAVRPLKLRRKSLSLHDCYMKSETCSLPLRPPCTACFFGP